MVTRSIRRVRTGKCRAGCYLPFLRFILKSFLYNLIVYKQLTHV
nr:MAG TPA: hypothetical protein [Microviridae sp.]